MRKLLALVVALVTCLLSANASADRVPSPPPDCLEGSTPATGHGGPYCRPNSCKTDTDCKDTTVCRQLPLCVGTVTAGGRRPPKAPRRKFPTVLGRCDKADGKSCKLPDGAANRYWGVKKGTCQSMRLCVPSTTAPPATATATGEPTAQPTGEPTAQPTQAHPSSNAPTSSTAAATAAASTAATDPPPAVDRRPPCSCAGSEGDLSPLMIGLVMLWLMLRRRRPEPA